MNASNLENEVTHPALRNGTDGAPVVRLAGSVQRVISSGVLFNGTSEVIIQHAGSSYRLRITRQNKLILNK